MLKFQRLILNRSVPWNAQTRQSKRYHVKTKLTQIHSTRPSWRQIDEASYSSAVISNKYWRVQREIVVLLQRSRLEPRSPNSQFVPDTPLRLPSTSTLSSLDVQYPYDRDKIDPDKRMLSEILDLWWFMVDFLASAAADPFISNPALCGASSR